MICIIQYDQGWRLALNNLNMGNHTCLLGKPCRVQSLSDDIITCITPKQPMETGNVTFYPGKTPVSDVTVGCYAWLCASPLRVSNRAVCCFRFIRLRWLFYEPHAITGL